MTREVKCKGVPNVCLCVYVCGGKMIYGSLHGFVIPTFSYSYLTFGGVNAFTSFEKGEKKFVEKFLFGMKIS